MYNEEEEEEKSEVAGEGSEEDSDNDADEMVANFTHRNSNATSPFSAGRSLPTNIPRGNRTIRRFSSSMVERGNKR